MIGELSLEGVRSASDELPGPQEKTAARPLHRIHTGCRHNHLTLAGW